ncbi:MAG: HNH endonuclease [Caldilineaceae bacterium]|nr:HNH endonuclease [Caldilineaceae bacterium]
MQNRVFVLDTDRRPLSPCHPARARELLRTGKAAIFRRYPFTIILNGARPDADPAPLTLKVDPGGKTSGLALVQNSRVVWAAELTHRGAQIKAALQKRRAIRRSRRNRKPRFLNRTRRAGRLAPSLQSRVDNLRSWCVRLRRLTPVSGISMELVRFDTQLMQNAEVTGVEYQQGELAGYEVREYLLEKWGRTCVYCGASGVPLEVEHITPKARGGSDRVSNLALACRECNQAKGSRTAAEFGHAAVQAKARQPLEGAAAVNATRWAVWRMFVACGLPVEVGAGGRTQFNRTRQGYPKAHWIDAACVGESGGAVRLCAAHQPLQIKAMGRGTRRMVNCDRYGFPRGKAKQFKRVRGFQTGDIVRAVVPQGKKKGVYEGAVSIRASGSFKIGGQVDGISWRYCRLLHRVDGYDYSIPPGGGFNSSHGFSRGLP